MSESFTRLRELLGALAASDPHSRRFGAARHRYALAPPIDERALEPALESAGLTPACGAALPPDYLEYVTRLSAGGVGPYYGLLRIDRAAAFALDAPAGITSWRRGLPIAHVGCGYAAVVVAGGPAAGQIWLDARQLGMLVPIHASFTAFYLDWIDRVTHSEWLDGFVPPGECAITAALSGYLAVCEQRLGLVAGTLDGEALRTALANLGPGAIEVTADGPAALFAPGDRVDPCATCARALQGLAEQGLRSDVVAPGLPPLPERDSAVTPAP